MPLTEKSKNDAHQAELKYEIDRASLPDIFKDIGGDCLKPAEQWQLLRFCDSDNRVVGLIQIGDHLWSKAPSHMQVLTDNVYDDAANHTLIVALEGERLYVNHTTCGICARSIGYFFVGELPLLSDKQLTEAQAFMKLSHRKALRTRKDWQEAYPKVSVPPKYP